MKYSTRVKAGFVIALCAIAGAAAGIAGGAAAPSGQKARSSRAMKPPGRPFGRGPEVHAVAVVLNKAGNGFVTVTEDSGTVESVSGNQLTIKEGTKSVTYKTVPLTIPSGATVYRNFAKAQLSDLKAGDRVHVAQSSEGVFVMADDGSHRPPFRDGPGHGHGPGPDGPGPEGPRP
jgi:hypothetical protein